MTVMRKWPYSLHLFNCSRKTESQFNLKYRVHTCQLRVCVQSLNLQRNLHLYLSQISKAKVPLDNRICKRFLIAAQLEEDKLLVVRLEATIAIIPVEESVLVARHRGGIEFDPSGVQWEPLSNCFCLWKGKYYRQLQNEIVVYLRWQNFLNIHQPQSHRFLPPVSHPFYRRTQFQFFTMLAVGHFSNFCYPNDTAHFISYHPVSVFSPKRFYLELFTLWMLEPV